MSFEFRPRPAPVLAGLLAAGLMLTVAGCGLTPLGPDAAATAPPPSPPGLLVPAEDSLGPGVGAARVPDHDHPARGRCDRGDSGRHDGL